MIVVKTPGINGLGKTENTRDAGNRIIFKLKESGDFRIEEIHVDNSKLDEQEELIYKNSLEFFENEDRIIFLGGDHSISYGIGKAFFDYCREEKKESCLIVFDAHADCMQPMREPTHEEWLRALVDYGFIPENILLIGVRKIELEEKKFLKKKDIKIISVGEIRRDIDGIIGRVENFIFNKEIYMSFDIDVLDSGIVMSTGYPEPYGLRKDEILKILDFIGEKNNLKAFDFVELDVRKKGFGKDLEIAGEVVSKILKRSSFK